jgi:hypothetical protein
MRQQKDKPLSRCSQCDRLAMVYSRCPVCDEKTFYCDVHFEDEASPTLLNHTPKCSHGTIAEAPPTS